MIRWRRRLTAVAICAVGFWSAMLTLWLVNGHLDRLVLNGLYWLAGTCAYLGLGALRDIQAQRERGRSQ